MGSSVGGTVVEMGWSVKGTVNAVKGIAYRVERTVNGMEGKGFNFNGWDGRRTVNRVEGTGYRGQGTGHKVQGTGYMIWREGERPRPAGRPRETNNSTIKNRRVEKKRHPTNSGPPIDTWYRVNDTASLSVYRDRCLGTKLTKTSVVPS